MSPSTMSIQPRSIASVDHRPCPTPTSLGAASAAAPRSIALPGTGKNKSAMISLVRSSPDTRGRSPPSPTSRAPMTATGPTLPAISETASVFASPLIMPFNSKPPRLTAAGR